MMRHLELSKDDVASLLLALEGNEPAKANWQEKFRGWTCRFNRQMDLYKMTREWLIALGRRTGVHLGRHDWDTDEENLMDWVAYQMEYTGGLVWDEAAQSVKINKYASWRPLLDDVHTQELLDFLTKEMKSCPP